MAWLVTQLNFVDFRFWTTTEIEPTPNRTTCRLTKHAPPSSEVYIHDTGGAILRSIKQAFDDVADWYRDWYRPHMLIKNINYTPSMTCSFHHPLPTSSRCQRATAITSSPPSCHRRGEWDSKYDSCSMKPKLINLYNILPSL